MDVHKFNVKTKSIVDRIHGCCKSKDHLPADLAHMVAECYLETDIQQFDLKAIEIVNALDEDLSKYSTTQVQTMLGNKYTSLLHNDRWPHKSKMQELSEAVGQLQALSTEVGHLKALQLKQPGGTAGSTSTPKAEKQDTSNPAVYVVPKEGGGSQND